MHPCSRFPIRPYAVVSETPNSVLLESSRLDAENYRSLLFLDPIRILSTAHLDEIPNLFQQVEDELAAGHYIAGFVSYECGYHFQPIGPVTLPPSQLPLIWFGVYREPLVRESLDRESLMNDRRFRVTDYESCLAPGEPDHPMSSEQASFSGPLSLAISEDEYSARVHRIRNYIEAGDTYQVNFTDSIAARLPSSPQNIFENLSKSQPVPYGAFLNTAGHQILSFSPELFFRMKNGRIVTRPMKGTMNRGRDSAEDVEAAAWLQHDEKNRAEHVMIVDLLRNDLGRICKMGSVQVEDIFTIEKYETLFQMTSTISGTLQPDLTCYQIFQSMFPCGSITGAPKVRTMQIIRELEQGPRGVYTGAIGFIAPDRSCVFNVAIRTLVLKDGKARMGVGSGIVADSRAPDEYRECLLKANFLTRPRRAFQIIETMLWDHDYTFLDMHLQRMQASASYFDYLFDRAAIISVLEERASGFLAGERRRVKVLLDSHGSVVVEDKPLTSDRLTGHVRVSTERTSSGDIFLRHKTTSRQQYDRLYQEALDGGFDEILFLNEREHVTEGAISNIFVLLEGKLVTPPLSAGVLPGVFRRHVLETWRHAEERVLGLNDLESADGVFLCNSVRGMRPVSFLCLDASHQQEGEASPPLVTNPLHQPPGKFLCIALRNTNSTDARTRSQGHPR